MIEAPSLERIQYNNWLKRQANMAPVDEDWVNDQKNTMFMDGYRPNASLVPGVSTTPADPQGFNRSSGVGIANIPEVPTNEQMFLNGYNPNFGTANGEWEEKEEPPVPKGTGQEQPGNAMFAAIQEELQRNDDGTARYAMSVLQRLPEVFAKYENADPSRSMPYFLAGQPGRQRETEMVRFNDFMR